LARAKGKKRQGRRQENGASWACQRFARLYGLANIYRGGSLRLANSCRGPRLLAFYSLKVAPRHFLSPLSRSQAAILWQLFLGGQEKSDGGAFGRLESKSFFGLWTRLTIE
jgi:hypothetical protein